MKITIYGAQWCKDTRRVLNYLEDQGVIYTLLEIDNPDNGKEYTQTVIELNNGKRITPILHIAEEVYPNPSNKDLEEIINNLPQDETLARCSNGKVLENGDTVLLTRDLDVKGSSLNLKQGTALEKIKLTGDPAYIDVRIGKSTLAIKTEFIKKKG